MDSFQGRHDRDFSPNRHSPFGILHSQITLAPAAQNRQSNLQKSPRSTLGFHTINYGHFLFILFTNSRAGAQSY